MKRLFLILGILYAVHPAFSQRLMETLNRGIYAINRGNNEIFISWRMLGTDEKEVAFNVYRSKDHSAPEKLNSEPITTVTYFVYKDSTMTTRSYFVRPIINGHEGEESEHFTMSNSLQTCLTIPLKTPEGYRPNDAAIGDLNGDGALDLVLKQEQSPHDPSHSGATNGTTKLEAYTLQGDFLWRIDLGVNIREGAHYTPFIVYDLNSDGYAEVAVRTAEGTIDGEGNKIGDENHDGKTNYVNSTGRILEGPEFISIYDGRTGKELARDYYIERGEVTDWGDAYGNRLDRHLMAVAYLDGVHPSLIICRGYYNGRRSFEGKTVIMALDYNNGQINKRWTFTAKENGINSSYSGQGNHNLSIGDVDGDGKDEIIYGAMALDDNGEGLYTTGLGHGDAIHLSDIDPTHPGLELFMPHEDYPNIAGLEMRDAESGELLWGIPSVGDVGRGVTMDIDSTYPGYEVWGRGGGIYGLYTAQGVLISNNQPRGCNFGIWWDGDLIREQLDGTLISKWVPETEENQRILDGYRTFDVGSNNWTKKNPCLSGDILGDWREEVIWRSNDNQKLIIACTTEDTPYRMYTLLQDPIYRLSLNVQNVGYNQPPQPGFFFGAGMTFPEKPDLKIIPIHTNSSSKPKSN